MGHVQRFAMDYVRGVIFVVAALSVCAAVAGALDADDPVSLRAQILRSLHEVEGKYGPDAVMLEGHLLGHAIQGGSILDAVVSVPGMEERGSKKFLAFKLETGIIYNDRELGAPARTARAWRDIVEPTLRKFRTVTVPADGIALILGYAHKSYVDEAELRARLGEDHGAAEVAAFYLLLSDVTELIAEHITAQQLVDRSTVLVNGAAIPLPLEASPTP